MQRTGIEYLTHTWNPIAMRCTPVSAGCAHCWHLAMANRLGGKEDLGEDRRAAYQGEEPPVLLIDELEAPLKLRKPARIGVQFMGDLFHENVTIEMRERVYQTIEACPQHFFVILTKRPERVMAYWFAPPPNIWLGVSVEDQPTADERIPGLLRCPAAVRLVSAEPMLGPIGFDCVARGMGFTQLGEDEQEYVSWVVVGGETGPGARLAQLEWFYDIRDQCRAASVALFVKTLGTALERELGKPRGWLPDDLRIHEYPTTHWMPLPEPPQGGE